MSRWCSSHKGDAALNQQFNRHKRQAGVTLVEMMISVVLGLLLMAGVITFFISTKQGHRLQSGMGMMQENGRAALHILFRDILMAGYPKSASVDAILDLQTIIDNDPLPGNVTAILGANADNDPTDADPTSRSDALGIQYQTDLDCLGAATPASGYAKNVYSVVYTAADDSDLVCTTLAEDNTLLDSQTLIEGVENMQILYGVDDDTSDNISNATRYLRAGNVTDWNAVISIRIGILVNSIDTLSTTDDTATYDLLGQGTIAAKGDRMRRRSHTSTITIRNRL